MIVPTSIFICVTPEENIPGKNLLKKIFIFLDNLNSKFKFGEKYFFAKKYTKINCINPANETPYDNKITRS